MVLGSELCRCHLGCLQLLRLWVGTVGLGSWCRSQHCLSSQAQVCTINRQWERSGALSAAAGFQQLGPAGPSLAFLRGNTAEKQLIGKARAAVDPTAHQGPQKLCDQSVPLGPDSPKLTLLATRRRGMCQGCSRDDRGQTDLSGSQDSRCPQCVFL